MRIQKFKTRYRITLTLAQYARLEDILVRLEFDTPPVEEIKKYISFACKFNKSKIEEGRSEFR